MSANAVQRACAAADQCAQRTEEGRTPDNGAGRAELVLALSDGYGGDRLSVRARHVMIRAFDGTSRVFINGFTIKLIIIYALI